MRRQRVHRLTFAILILSHLPICFSAETSDPNDPNRYLNAVREFADNVLTYGRDTYGPKHTPLFVDGLNIHTHEPVKWIAPNGDRWILCNLASQQNLFRTLDGLTGITGDPKYKQAAMDAIKYAFENLRSPNGLLYWGGHIAYDVGDEKVCARGPSNNHELKAHFPYYELMWHVDAGATRQFIEAFWSAHILDWSNLDMNRHGHTERTLDTPWPDEYKGGDVFFWGQGLTFMSTGSDLFYSGAVLSHLSGEKRSLVWAKRLAYRYVETRNPKTGISGYQYSQLKSAFCCGPSIRGDRAQYQFGDDFKGHFVVEGTLFPCYGSTPAVKPRICEFLLGEMLGAQGKQFTQWASEELRAWGKVAYRKEDNSFIPMLTDGTSMEGYVCKKDGYFGPKGRVLKAGRAGPLDFWTYTLAYRVTGDAFMWEMARNIAQGNKLGDIGPDPEAGSHLDKDTDCSSAYALLGFLELYKSEKNNVFLEMAQKIGDNILAARFHRGFFVPSNRHIYARFDNLEPLSLLHLDAVASTRSSSVSWVWPSSSFLACEYYGRGTAYDTSLIYTLTDSAEPPMTLQVAATVGDLDELRTLLSIESGAPARKQATLDNLFLLAAEAGHAHIVEFLLGEGAQINSGTTTALHYAVQNGHKDVVELLLAKGADVNAKDGAQQTPIDLAMGRNHKEIAQHLLAKGATISSIHVAAQAGDLAKVKAFLEEGADINTADARGLTPLHHAVRAARKDVAEFLMAKGADVNGKGDSGYIPLSWAIWNEDREMIKLLVTNGADVNFIGEDDWPFLHYLTWNNDRELVELFLAHRAKLNVKDKRAWTEFHIAVLRGNRDLARFLVSKGATAPELHLAACLGDLARVKSFLEEGVDVDTKDEVGWTPLHWAASMAEEEVAEFLVGKGADINVRTNNNRTLLHQAATAGAVKLTNLLISKGADVNARDEGNGTPLHSASAGGHKEVVQLLLKSGADVNVQDNRKRTPLDIAISQNHSEIVDLLRTHGAKE
jgi:pectate lyase